MVRVPGTLGAGAVMILLAAPWLLGGCEEAATTTGSPDVDAVVGPEVAPPDVDEQDTDPPDADAQTETTGPDADAAQTDDTETVDPPDDVVTPPEDCSVEGACPAGTYCVDTDDGAECRDAHAGLCWPCYTDADCDQDGSGARCVDFDGRGAFCGTTCAGGCPDGTACEAVTLVTGTTTQRCVPAEGALCTCPEGAAGLDAPCARDNDHGICDGVVTCQPDGSLSACSATEPGAEICGGGDENCDGEVDEIGAEGCEDFLADADEDGFGDDADVACVCEAAYPYTTHDGGDCNDLDEKVHGCTIYYSDVDGDGLGDGDDSQCLCSPAAPYTATETGCAEGDGTIVACVVYYADSDGDGLGDPDSSACLCEPQAPWIVTEDGDCDDGTGDVGACTLYWYDFDVDGAGDLGNAQCLCEPEGKYTASNGGDCNDAIFEETPGKLETCDGYDNDCNGQTDEPGADKCHWFFYDGDGDEFGVTAQTVCVCASYGKYTADDGGDCNDLDPEIYPGQPCSDAVCEGFIISGLCPSGYCGAGSEAAPCAGGFNCLDDEHCRISCSNKIHCAPGHFCTDHECIAEKANGEACTKSEQCASDHCNNGFCCKGGDCCGGAADVCDDGNVCTDDTCSALFQCAHIPNTSPCADTTCSGGSWVGAGSCELGACVTPTPIDCEISESDTCTTYSCDTAAGCQVAHAGAGTECASLMCVDFEIVQPMQCDGAGGCTLGGSGAPCDNGYACKNDSACGTTCSVHTDCQPDTYCKGAKCIPKHDPGGPCATDAQCLDSTCQGGVCCDGCCDNQSIGTTEYPRSMELCGGTSYAFQGHASCSRIISDFGAFNHQDHSPLLEDTAMVHISSGIPNMIAEQNWGEIHGDFADAGPAYSGAYDDPDGTFSVIRDLCGFEMDLVVPNTAQGFAFDFIFFSSEYPEWLDQGFNDSFNAILTSSGFNGNVSFDSLGSPISINNVLFTICDGCDEPPSALAGTGFDNNVGGATGWLTTTVPVKPGETIHLYFSVYDEGDSWFDSDALINNFRWLEFQPGTGPVTE